ncbi:MAG TPA: thiamine pyrophosphate-dependent enzyme [bacterium]|jgi:2-oxoglutarate ferredoxin oxidoreductase subunit beta
MIQNLLEEQVKPKGYSSGIESTWCPGCGDFGVTNALAKTFSGEMVDAANTVLVSGIGCSSRLPLWMSPYGFHSLHGRALPVAVGMKIANPKLDILVTIGDGDAFSIGGGHFPHAARRNFDMAVVVMDNKMYALTKNQCSPTSRLDYPGSLSPSGNVDEPMNTLGLVLSYGATFVAQTFSGKPKHVAEMVEKAMKHTGFSFVNVLSPCPTYNKFETFEFWKGRVEEIPEDHDATDKIAALAISEEGMKNEKIPIGILYQVTKPTYEDQVRNVKGRYNSVPADQFDLNKVFDSLSPMNA